jgi:hypothetical protein
LADVTRVAADDHQVRERQYGQGVAGWPAERHDAAGMAAGSRASEAHRRLPLERIEGHDEPSEAPTSTSNWPPTSNGAEVQP